MTPREPDRFEAKARELLHEIRHGVLNMEQAALHLAKVAAALRQAESSALERAAQIVGEYGSPIANVEYVMSRIRALASPAAAPAAEMCRAECASRMPDYSHFECTLPKGHTGPHKEGSFAEWTDATTAPAPPSEPAAPEKGRCFCGQKALSSATALLGGPSGTHTSTRCDPDALDPLRAIAYAVGSAESPAAPSLLPRVLAALEDYSERDSEVRSLAAELRRYIADGEGKT